MGPIGASGASTPGCQDLPSISHTLDVAGSVVSWISGTVYFCSRFPQIWLNFKRKSTEGLSRGMFVLCILGNVTYGMSVILRLPTIDSSWYANSLPYLIGSIGTLVFDVTIFCQFIAYRK